MRDAQTARARRHGSRHARTYTTYTSVLAFRVLIESTKRVVAGAGTDQAPSLQAMHRSGVDDAVRAHDPVSLPSQLLAKRDPLGSVVAGAEVEPVDGDGEVEQVVGTHLGL